MELGFGDDGFAEESAEVSEPFVDAGAEVEDLVGGGPRDQATVIAGQARAERLVVGIERVLEAGVGGVIRAQRAIAETDTAGARALAARLREASPAADGPLGEVLTVLEADIALAAGEHERAGLALAGSTGSGGAGSGDAGSGDAGSGERAGNHF